jgi:hypothetical protein
MNVLDDEAAHLLRVLTRRCSHALHAKHVVEPCLLLLEGLLNLVEARCRS